ncbi:MAG: primosomal protein N' [Ruminococcaceae bacterium]|nr:primosomal protein N' [Oscillospiraceae bacterium]
MIAKIAVSAANFAIDKPYSYFAPEELQLLPGVRVIVPFGRGNHRTEGVVLSVEEGAQTGLKSVITALDAVPVLSDEMLRMAAMLRSRYFCTFYDAIRAILPAGLWYQRKDTYALTEDCSWKEKKLRQADAVRLLEHIDALGDRADGDALRQVVPDENAFSKAIAYLIRNKWITSDTDYLSRSGEKTERVATLATSVEEAMEYASSRSKSAQMQKSVLELLCSVGSAAVKEICYFTGAKTATVNRLAELGYVALSERKVLRCREIRKAQLNGPLCLNEEQEAVYRGLSSQLVQHKPGAALLYGVTGSGKTSVYIKLIEHTLKMGKQAMLLVPEIALTSQLLSLMAAHFDDQVAVLHSSLPTGERFDQWNRVRAGEAGVIVGTRSAVFAPCPNLGLIILDEEQEHSYKSENAPRYSAKEVALWRGMKNNALVLFGSATPSVETMYYAKSGIYSLYRLHKRYNGRNLPLVEIVDMHRQMESGNDSAISYPLQDAMGETMEAGRQTVLFLNRRGNSRALICVDCRQTPECPRCEERLTYHSANNRMMCHYCGFSQSVPHSCLHCNGTLKPVGTGTQKVETELSILFPDAAVARMDADTVNAVNTHDKILEQFQKEKIPVLLGTQMVAKGLNLPNVALVGVLDGDIGLYSGSYRAAETTFNMLTQVVGRAGRGDTPGRAIIQTMTPEHKVITLAAKQDYDSFYELEIGLRERLHHPPFGDLVFITVTGKNEWQVIRGAAKLRDSLEGCLRDPAYHTEACTILGPAACAVPKINYSFRYRLTLKCKFTPQLRQLVAHMLRQFSLDKENRGVAAFVDVNGFE